MSLSVPVAVGAKALLLLLLFYRTAQSPGVIAAVPELDAAQQQRGVWPQSSAATAGLASSVQGWAFGLLDYCDTPARTRVPCVVPPRVPTNWAERCAGAALGWTRGTLEATIAWAIGTGPCGWAS